MEEEGPGKRLLQLMNNGVLDQGGSGGHGEKQINLKYVWSRIDRTG